MYGHPLFAETYACLGFGSVFAVSFLCFLRGNEPYQLNLAQVLDDLVTMPVARRRRCTPHFSGNFSVTKTMRSASVRIACVLLSKAGIDLGSFLIPFLVLRQRLPCAAAPPSSLPHPCCCSLSFLLLRLSSFLPARLHSLRRDECFPAVLWAPCSSYWSQMGSIIALPVKTQSALIPAIGVPHP